MSASGAHATTWGATPLFVNNTVYVGTPKYNIFAVEPDTGKLKWIYVAPTVPMADENQGLKNRGVAYWAASNPVAGQPCQKMVYIGTMSGELHGVDADTGKPCAGFGKDGVLDVKPVAHHQQQVEDRPDPAACGLQGHADPGLGGQ